ncbi:MAG: type 4a pilus biogenesis protein PilO [Gaiellaceae bacterium]
MKRGIPKPALIALIVVGLVLLGAGGYFMLIGPQKSKASDLDKQIADTNQAIDSARALTLQAKQGAKIRVADLFRLTKAMPDQTDMSDILLELNQVAQDSGITFEQITPSATAVALSGYEAIPITVEFQGNFYELSDFLFRLRNLVDVRHGALDASGRLFAVDTIAFAQAPPPPGFPEISANLVIDAFVFGTGTVPTVEPPGATTPGSGTTGATGATGTTGTTGATGTTGTTATTTPTTGTTGTSGATAAAAGGGS